MTQRRHHYERAFEEYLRARRIPYVAVDEAKKALLPEGEHARLTAPSNGGEAPPASLKSFDMVLYGEGQNLLVEVKGRRIRRGASPRPGADGATPPARARLDSWVTLDDVESLGRWEGLFGPGFSAAFVFVYWCDEQPPDGLFTEVFEHAGRWYAVRAVDVRDYAGAMRTRSPRWRTVHVLPATFERLWRPLAAPTAPGDLRGMLDPRG